MLEEAATGKYNYKNYKKISLIYRLEKSFMRFVEITKIA